MQTDAKSKGTWVHRFAIRLFTLVLAVLIFWVLGFFVDDIRSIRGPDYATIERKHLDKELVARRDALDKLTLWASRAIVRQDLRELFWYRVRLVHRRYARLARRHRDVSFRRTGTLAPTGVRIAARTARAAGSI